MTEPNYITVEELLNIAQTLYDQSLQLEAYWSVVLANALNLQKTSASDFENLSKHMEEAAGAITNALADLNEAQQKAIQAFEMYGEGRKIDQKIH